MSANNDDSQGIPGPTRSKTAGSRTKDPRVAPIWSRRVWTGNGTLDVAVFRHVVQAGTTEIVSYNTAAKRLWKVGEESRESRSFRSEDLLPLARLLGQAFDFITQQQD